MPQPVEQAPLNRAGRRKLARPARQKTPAKPGSLAAVRQAQARQSQSTPPPPAIATGAPFSAIDAEEGEPTATMDEAPAPFSMGALFEHAPADRGAGAGGPATFTGYKGKHGPLKTGIVSTYGMAGALVSRFDPVDGMLIVQQSENVADAWIALGKADPRVMRVLQTLFGNPAMIVVMAHVAMIEPILRHHNASPLSLFSGLKLPGKAPAGDATRAQTGPADSVPSQPAPLPYVPAGAHAPTDLPTPPPPMPMPPADPDSIRMFPDTELPSEIEVALRQAARQTGRPYAELRQEALLQLAQLQMEANGHVRAPGALGAPVSKE